MTMRLTATLMLTTLTSVVTPALAHAGHHVAARQAIAVTNAWARETAPAQVNGGGFLTITNKGQADRLVSASSTVAPTVQLHTMSMDGGVMRMRELPDGIPVPAQSVVELKPGGMHIMFIGLKAPLKPGQSVALTLRFENMDGGHDHH
jgi:copper(I)-binding protein